MAHKEHEAARGALSHEPESKSEHEHSHSHAHHGVHVERMEHGYKIHKHHKDGHVSEHAAGDVDDMMDHVYDHMTSQPDEGDEAAGPQEEAGAPEEPAGPDGEQAEQAPEPEGE